MSEEVEKIETEIAEETPRADNQEQEVETPVEKAATAEEGESCDVTAPQTNASEVNGSDPDTTEKETPKKIDYAKEAYECFIKNADPETTDADPVAAIQRVFDRRASEDLKDRVAAEGKTAEGAYAFLWSVARKKPHTDNGCHISPETGYAIAMHYFEDVPACAEWEPKLKKEKEEREAAKRKEAEAARKAEDSKKGKGKEKAKRKAKEKAKDSESKKEIEKTAPVSVEPTKKKEHPQEARDRANGQGFLFDCL